MAPHRLEGPNHNTTFYAVFTVFTVLSTTSLALRFYSRRIKHVSLFLEDYLATAAWIFAAAQSAMIVQGTKTTGFGYHATEVSEEQLVTYAKGYYAASFLQPSALAMAKLSVLLQLKRIFVIPWFRKLMYVLLTVVGVWWLGSLLAYALICIPPKANWDPTIPHHCGNAHILNVLDPLPWIITDFVILLCPMPMVRTLHLSNSKKVGLVGVFLTGGFTCIVACVRYSSVISLETTKDPTWDGVDTSIWNIIETNVSVVCACIIVIQPALKKVVVEGLILPTWSILTKNRSSEKLAAQESDSMKGPTDAARRAPPTKGVLANEHNAVPLVDIIKPREEHSSA